MTLDPRKRFADSAHASHWHDTVATDCFAAAAETAMVVMQSNLVPINDLANASANHFRMEGARQFLATLMNLTEKAPAPRITNTGNLEHRI